MSPLEEINSEWRLTSASDRERWRGPLWLIFTEESKGERSQEAMTAARSDVSVCVPRSCVMKINQTVAGSCEHSEQQRKRMGTHLILLYTFWCSYYLNVFQSLRLWCACEKYVCSIWDVCNRNYDPAYTEVVLDRVTQHCCSSFLSLYRHGVHFSPGMSMCVPFPMI